MRLIRKSDLLSSTNISSVSVHDDWYDRAALGASLLCLVHCLALPLLLAALPTLAEVIAIPESFHSWLLLFAIPASGAALMSGRARHGALWPICAGAFGLLFLTLGALVFGHTSGETAFTVAGSLALATAHIGNWRLRHACKVITD